MKPRGDTNCNDCPRRFECFTGKGEACPTINGSEITYCYPCYNNVCIGLSKDDTNVFWKYRITPDQMLKLVQRAKFRTYKKYNRIYLEVLDE